MPPLEAIYRAKVTLATVSQAACLEERLRTVPVPDLDAFGREARRICRPRDEPQQFGDYGAQEDALRRQQRQQRRAVAVERELERLRREDGVGARPGSAT